MARRQEESEAGKLAGAITTAAGAYLLAPPGTRLPAAAVALTPSVVERITEAWRIRLDARRRLFLDAYLRGQPVEDEQFVEAELYALADDPKTRDLVFDAFRVIDETMIEEAVVVMGLLTRRYRANGWKADWFSRGVRRIMTEVAEDDYLSLCEILAILDKVESAVDDVSLRFHSTGDAPHLAVAYPHRLQPDAGARTEAHPTKARPDCMSRVLELLKAARFARDGASVNSGAVAGVPGMVMTLSSARGLLSLMPRRDS